MIHTSIMPIDDRLLARVLGEYREMPGLRLTLPQASRLWHLDGPACLALLEHLVHERHLHQTQDGSYIALPTGRPRPVKAALRVAPRTGSRPRHRR